MNKILSLALLFAGLLLISSGLLAYDSSTDDLPRIADVPVGAGSLWLMIGGVAAACVGLFGLAREFRGYSRAFPKSTDSMQ